MQNSLLQLLFVLATLSSLTEASPVAAPQSTSASSLRKRVIVHDFLHARRDQISKRYTNGTTFIDLPVAQRELERLSQKYNQSNTRYQKHIKSGKVKRNAEQFAIRSVSAGEPYDLALHRRNSLQKRQNAATVSLTDDVELGVDVSYYSENLQIGTPAQTFAIDFDTGSADLWVLGSGLSTSTEGGDGSPFGGGNSPLGGGGQTEQHNYFVGSQSSSNTASTTPFQIQYGSGDAEGTASRDVVSLNGLSVPRQVFGVATSVSDDFTDSPFDGLMGIGFSSISELEANTWTENLVLNKAVASNLFSIALGRGSVGVPDTDSDDQVLNSNSGSIIFGALDSDLYSGNIVYQPVTTQAYWQVALDGFASNGKVISGTSVQAAIDSGTSLVYVPTTVAAAIASSIGAKAYTPSNSRSSSSSTGYYSMSCSQLEDLNLAISFGNTLFQFNNTDLNAGQVTSSQCLLSIVGADTNDPNGQPLAIVGDAFMKNVYAVFDYSNGVRVGMASRTGGTTSTASGSDQSDSSSNKSSSATSVMLSLSTLFLGLFLTLLR